MQPHSPTLFRALLFTRLENLSEAESIQVRDVRSRQGPRALARICQWCERAEKVNLCQRVHDICQTTHPSVSRNLSFPSSYAVPPTLRQAEDIVTFYHKQHGAYLHYDRHISPIPFFYKSDRVASKRRKKCQWLWKIESSLTLHLLFISGVDPLLTWLNGSANVPRSMCTFPTRKSACATSLQTMCVFT